MKRLLAVAPLLFFVVACSGAGGSAPTTAAKTQTLSQQNKARLLSAVAREKSMSVSQQIAAGVSRGVSVYRTSSFSVVDVASHKSAVFPASSFVTTTSSGITVSYGNRVSQFSASARLSTPLAQILIFGASTAPVAGDLPQQLAQSTSRTVS